LQSPVPLVLAKLSQREVSKDSSQSPTLRIATSNHPGAGPIDLNHLKATYRNLSGHSGHLPRYGLDS